MNIPSLLGAQERLRTIMKERGLYSEHAYMFMFDVVTGILFRQRHVDAPQIQKAIEVVAQDQFGYLAKLVFKRWGLNTSNDFGKIMDDMVKAGILVENKDQESSTLDSLFTIDELFNEQKFKFKFTPRRPDPESLFG